MLDKFIKTHKRSNVLFCHKTNQTNAYLVKKKSDTALVKLYKL